MGHCAYPLTRPSLLQQAHSWPWEMSWLQTRGHWAAVKWKYTNCPVCGRAACHLPVAVRERPWNVLLQRPEKTNPSHAQPEGVHLGMLGVLHKEQGSSISIPLVAVAPQSEEAARHLSCRDGGDEPGTQGGQRASALLPSLLCGRAGPSQAQPSFRAAISASLSTKWVASSSFVKNAANTRLRSKQCHAPVF